MEQYTLSQYQLEQLLLGYAVHCQENTVFRDGEPFAGGMSAKEYLSRNVPPTPQQSGNSGEVEGIDIDELWDEHSEYIDDDIDSLSNFAGRTVITGTKFKAMMQLLIAPALSAAKAAQPVQGLRWVACGKHLPPIEDWYDEPPKFAFRIKGDDPRSGWIDISYLTAEEIHKCWKDYEYCEWLSDSPAPEQSDAESAVDFALWFQERVTPYGEMFQMDGKLYHKLQLYTLFKQSR